MKKLVIYSEESIFSGNIKCGIAEVVDSLGNALTSDYEVSIICQEGNLAPASKLVEFIDIKEGVKFTRFLLINYYIIKKEKWAECSVSLINEIQPDILHNFDDPSLILQLDNIPQKTIHTFDDIDYIIEKTDLLYKYNYITTFSTGYKKLILENSSFSNKLNGLPFEDVRIGISGEILTPKYGLLIQAAYEPENQKGKNECKEYLCKKFNIPNSKFICLTMSRLVKEKGIEDILSTIPTINKNNGILIIIGEGEKEYEQQLKELSLKKEVIFINSKFSPFQIPPLLAGADFYLQPSLKESGGLMPMSASFYGTIPIITLNGGLIDNFNKENAIIISNNTDNAIIEAARLYKNQEELYNKRKTCMTQDFSWDTRKKDFIKLYES